MSKLSHLDEHGAVRMVDVSDKEPTGRRALARGHVGVAQTLLADLVDGKVPKGDVLAAARVAGIMAAKRTPELIPLCHTLNLSSVNIGFEVDTEASIIHIFAEARANDRTGVEMEALTAVSVAALTIYDMLKSVDREMTIGGIELVRKEGGRSGPYLRTVDVVSPPSIPPSATTPVAAEPAPESDIIDELEESLGALLAPRQPEGSSPPRPATTQALQRAPSVARLRGDEPDLIALLTKDPISSAYMLGDLDKPYAEHCQWYGLGNGQIESLLLLYTGLRMPAVLTKGVLEDIEALVEAARTDLPRRFYCHVRADHLAAFEPSFAITRPKEMIRMGLRKAGFTGAGQVDDVEALTHRDTAAIMQVYQHYPDNFFEPAQLGTGLYFGIKEGDQLLSVAGIHVMSQAYDVAAIGNIVTLPDRRGEGFATRSVGRLLAALFEQVGHVALNVDLSNSAAVACYAKFGFQQEYTFIEGWAEAR